MAVLAATFFLAAPASADTEGAWVPIPEPDNVNSSDTPAIIFYPSTNNTEAYMLGWRGLGTQTSLWSSQNSSAPVGVPGGDSPFAPVLVYYMNHPTMIWTGTDSRLYAAVMIGGTWLRPFLLDENIHSRSSPAAAVDLLNGQTIQVAYADPTGAINTVTLEGDLLGTFVARRNGALPGNATTFNAPAIAALPYDGNFSARFVIAHRGTDSRIYTMVEYSNPQQDGGLGNWQRVQTPGASDTWMTNFGPHIAARGNEIRIDIRTQDNRMAYIGGTARSNPITLGTDLTWGNWRRDFQEAVMSTIATIAVTFRTQSFRVVAWLQGIATPRQKQLE